jgi:hypothetical protein
MSKGIPSATCPLKRLTIKISGGQKLKGPSEYTPLGSWGGHQINGETLGLKLWKEPQKYL